MRLTIVRFDRRIKNRKLPKKKVYIYVALVLAMIFGRLVWGIMMFLCTGINGGTFSMSAFIAGAVTNAVPGIILQLIIVPLLVMGLNRGDNELLKSLAEKNLL